MAGRQSNEIRRALGRCKGNFLMVGLFSLVINLLVLSSPLYMMQIYDRVLTGRSHSTLIAFTILVAGLLLIMGILEMIRSRILVRVGTKIDGMLHERVYQASVAKSLNIGQKSDDGPMRDLRSLREFLSGQGPFALFDTPWVPIYLTVIFIVHPLLGYVAAGGAALLFTLGLINEFWTRSKIMAATTQGRMSDQLASASQRNAEVLTAMGMLNGLRLRWQAMHRQALHEQSIASDRAGTVTAASKTTKLILQAAILGTGAALAIEQAISPGAMIAASIIMGRALAPVDQAIGNWRGFVGARAAYHRLGELLSSHAIGPEPLRLPSADTRLHVENLVAGAPGAAMPTIAGLDFDLMAGEAMGVIGPSASGKSTLARLLVGVWPVRHGSIRLDGVAIDHWHPEDLSCQIGYLPQDVELFDGTVAENIARFARDIDPNAIVAAAKMASVHDMILHLPEGYNTRIGDGGSKLSGGQRQRIGLARAMFGSPFLVVLDEPNASLDSIGDRALTEAIQQMKANGQIVVVMAHRPSAIEACDKLLALHGGRQEAFGNKPEILASTIRNVEQIGQNVTNLEATRPVSAATS
ncbi:MAG: type I secretion system permease/ATPase [Geminicoccaceae bacterium]